MLPTRCVLSTTRGTDRYWYQENQLYTIGHVTNNSAAIVERYEFDERGLPTFFTGAGTDGNWNTSDDVTAASSAIGNFWLFQGRQYDNWGPAPLYYYRNRYMDPTHGRFTVVDSKGIWGDSTQRGNAYSFAHESAANWVDPTGTVARRHYVEVGDVVLTVWLENCDEAMTATLLTHVGNAYRSFAQTSKLLYNFLYRQHYLAAEEIGAIQKEITRAFGAPTDAQLAMIQEKVHGVKSKLESSVYIYCSPFRKGNHWGRGGSNVVGQYIGFYPVTINSSAPALRMTIFVPAVRSVLPGLTPGTIDYEFLSQLIIHESMHSSGLKDDGGYWTWSQHGEKTHRWRSRIRWGGAEYYLSDADLLLNNDSYVQFVLKMGSLR